MPSAAGGSPGIQARILSNELTKQMGQQVVVDNRPGASAIIGFEAIAKAAPDGYTFGYAITNFIFNNFAFAKLPYDSAKDFLPVGRQSYNPLLISVTPALPIRSVQELVAYAHTQPGKLSYGSTGAGAPQQLAIELLKSMTGTQILQITYKGIQQAITDTIGGQVTSCAM